MCAGERLHLEESIVGLVLSGLVAFCERFELDCLDNDERMAVLCIICCDFLGIVSVIMPVNLYLDVSRSREAADWQIQNLDDGWCWNSLRWRKDGLLQLFAESRLPPLVTLDNGHKISGQLVMVIGMFAWAYPRCQQDIARLFGESGQPVISRIVQFFLNHMLTNFLHLIQSDERTALLMWSSSADYFVQCVREKGGEYGQRFDQVGMFVDGTFNHTCRPDQREEHSAMGRDTQRAVYSKYYGGWGLKYLHCVFPNGIIGQLWGPVDGRRHDGHLFAISGINDKLACLSEYCGSDIHGD
jgi:hypothetical protein